MVTTLTQPDLHSQLSEASGILLQLGGGPAKQPEFIDLIPGGDIDWSHHDLPWPIPDEAAHIIVATNVAHHVDPTNGNFVAWMDEAWRVLRPNGQFAIVCPYGGGPAFLADPKACNPITEGTAFYFDPAHPAGMWQRYRAKPWLIENTSYHHQGTVELILRKRTLDELAQIEANHA